MSVIIVCYNHESYIEQTIKSVIDQNANFNYEIIISDDGSTDNTHKIIELFRKKYPHKIIDISNIENLGISENYKKCIKKANGKLISILEGDDYYLPGRLLQHKKFLEEHKNCKMVFSKIKIIDFDENIKYLERQNKIKKNELTYEDFFCDNSLNPIVNLSSCTIRSKFMKRLPDSIFNFRLSEISLAFYLLKFGNIGYINKELNTYRKHRNGQWNGLSNLEKKYSAYKIRKIAKNFLKGKYLDKIEQVINEDYMNDKELVKYINSHKN